MSYEQIAIANGITEPVNGSWIQAICESLGIMQPVNGSWTQVLAQYGPFPNGSGSGTLLENTASVVYIIYGVVYQNKGIDMVDIQIQFDYGVPFNQENSYKSITFSVTDSGSIPLFIQNGDTGYQYYTMGFTSGKQFISDSVQTIVGETYDIIITMFDVYQDLTTAPKTSLPIIHTFTSNP